MPNPDTTRHECFTPWRQGYAAGLRNEPMVLPGHLDAKHWNAWSTGYLVGQRDRHSNALMDEWEANDAQ